MPEIAKFIQVNAVGTALMLETIRERNLPVRKVVVASSQAVYNEGAYAAPSMATSMARLAPSPSLATRRFAMSLSHLRRRRRRRRRPTKTAPIGGENVYAIAKPIQERLLITWGRATGIPVVGAALFVHLWSAPIALQSVHRRDRHLLHPAR